MGALPNVMQCYFKKKVEHILNYTYQLEHRFGDCSGPLPTRLTHIIVITNKPDIEKY